MRKKIMINSSSSPKKQNVFIVYLLKGDPKTEWKMWYLADFDDDGNVGMWSSKLKDAQKFSDEEEVVDFCEIFLKGRKYHIYRL